MVASVACPALADEAGCPAVVVVGTAMLFIIITVARLSSSRRSMKSLARRSISMAIYCILISSKDILKLSCETNAPANGAGCLSCKTLHGASHMYVHMGACNSASARCMEYTTTLKPPELVAIHEVIQGYGTLADDWRCCRWPDTRLALQSSFTNLTLHRWGRR
eukprot:4750434-Pyramimonas_sp.AAC.1